MHQMGAELLLADGPHKITLTYVIRMQNLMSSVESHWHHCHCISTIFLNTLCPKWKQNKC